MRELLYVPIIHSEEDLGTMGDTLSESTSNLVGEERWQLHKDAVSRFWDRVAAFCCSLEPGQLKIYQDGLPAAGTVGRRIVEEAARRGSNNHQLVLQLANRGAELRKTEDPLLLLQERKNILGYYAEQAAQESLERYRLLTHDLMEKRDRFIARTISETLKTGELGLLFIGAYHNVDAHLATDISVKYIKSPETVRAYFEELLFGHDKERYRTLTNYLTSPVANV